MVGRRVLHFDILEKLGEGGMGVVYKARDTHLDRFVAIKVLPADKVIDPERRRRFVQEAKAASALQHPNIITVHDIARADGLDFIVMEQVEGQTLDAMIPRAGMRLGDALTIAAQIARALAAAHARGIVHRDIKPENVMVTPGGTVKVLDFGVAKLTEIAVPGPGAETRTAAARTGEGLIIGTAAYMSPEQAEGKPADARSDIFSFGAVLYEMVAGRRAFAGESTVSTLSAVLHQEPKPLDGLPRDLEKTIRRCLRKDPDKRFQHMDDVRVALEELKAESDAGTLTIGPAEAAEAKQPQLSRRLALKASLALVIVVAMGAALSWYLAARDERIDSIAVLPFVNMSGDPGNDYLGEEIPGLLINLLTQVPNLRVVPRFMAFRYRGKDVDTQKAGTELQARAILTGRIVQHGDSVSIETELTDVLKISQLWGARYTNILTVQDEMPRAILDALRQRLTTHEQRLIAKRLTHNPEAYDFYMKGLSFWNQRTEAAFMKGRQCFNQAVEKDPGYALAYVGLADCYSSLANSSYLSSREALPKAKTAALKALELEPDLAEAHNSVAIVTDIYDWNWQEAEREYKHAIELNPNYAMAHHSYGIYLDSMGRFDESLLEFKRALELEPPSLLINTQLGFHYFLARQYESGAKQLTATLELRKDFAYAHAHLGSVYRLRATLGEPVAESAVAEYQKAVALENSPRYIAMLGSSYATAGRRNEASQIELDLQALSKRKYVDPVLMAYLFASMGRKAEALAALETGYEERSYLMRWLNVQPNLDPLRSDPRFEALQRKMNFPVNLSRRVR